MLVATVKRGLLRAAVRRVRSAAAETARRFTWSPFSIIAMCARIDKKTCASREHIDIWRRRGWRLIRSAGIDHVRLTSNVHQQLHNPRVSGLSLYHNCDSTTIRLRHDDTTTHSTTTKMSEITICVRFDCDTTTIRLRRKTDMFIFCSRQIASNGSRRARYVVVGS